MRRVAILLVLSACCALGWPASSSAAPAKTITVGASTKVLGNCWPFGLGISWGPNLAFIYQNIPPIQLKTGDRIAFDTDAVNNADVQVDIALARTTFNGGDVNAEPFTTVVTNTQTPANPRGDATQGNFELSFTAQAPFSFPGGGLIIRVSNPSAAYATDGSCTGDLVGGATGDAGGFIVKRAYNDADGVSPWDNTDSNTIADFRITEQPSSNSFSLGTPVRNKHTGTASLPVTVPGPGTLTLGGSGVAAQTAGGRSIAHSSVAAAGTVNLTIRARGKAKKKLRQRHKVPLPVSVTFAPSGDPAGDPSSQTQTVRLVKKPNAG